MLIGRRHGYYPKDLDMAFINDWIVDTYYDYFEELVAPNSISQTGGSQQEVDAAIKKCFEVLIPKMMKQFENYLNHSQTQRKFLLSNELHVCDFVLGSFYTDMVTNPEAHSRTQFAKVCVDYPNLVIFGENYKATVANYLLKRKSYPL